MWLRWSAYSDSETIPRRFTREGEEQSPPLQWSDTSAETRSLIFVRVQVPQPLHLPDIPAYFRFP
jgi:hypothetical protein